MKLESIQRRFTKRLHGMWFLSYSDRLANLAVDSLELRRLKTDLVIMFKILNNIIDIDSSIFTLASFEINLRRHNKYLLKPLSRINCRAFSFACRNINTWNALPQNVIDCNSLSLFKDRLHSLNFNKFLPVTFD
jgi:hypothetical protein